MNNISFENQEAKDVFRNNIDVAKENPSAGLWFCSTL